MKAHIANTTSQYILPPDKVNLKNVASRKQLKTTFPDAVVQRNIDLDITLLDCYAKELSKIKWFLKQQARQHNPIHLLKRISGVGLILALTIL